MFNQSKSFSASAILRGSGGATARCAYNLTVHRILSTIDRVGGPPVSQPSYETEGGNLLFLNGEGDPDQTVFAASGLKADELIVMEASNGARYDIVLRGQPEELNGGWSFDARYVRQPPF